MIAAKQGRVETKHYILIIILSDKLFDVMT